MPAAGGGSFRRSGSHGGTRRGAAPRRTWPSEPSGGPGAQTCGPETTRGFGKCPSNKAALIEEEGRWGRGLLHLNHAAQMVLALQWKVLQNRRRVCATLGTRVCLKQLSEMNSPLSYVQRTQPTPRPGAAQF